jgi:hypothetical protein
MKRFALSLALIICGVLAAVYVANADEPPAKARPSHDYQHPPLGTWGLSWCGSRGTLWVHEANGTWWSYSSEDGTMPPPDAIGEFNDWIDSGPTDIREISGVTCAARVPKGT